MFVVNSPSDSDITDIQRTEGAFYWSKNVEMLFRKNGITEFSTSSTAQCNIVTRQAEMKQELLTSSIVFEGPLHSSTCSTFRIKTTNIDFEVKELCSSDGKVLGNLSYSSFFVRRIPETKKDKSNPYLFVSKDARWNNKTIRAQKFELLDGWQPLAYCQDCGDASTRELVAITNGKQILFGIPIFDLLLHSQMFPPLVHGYYSMDTFFFAFPIEQWLLKQVSSLCKANEMLCAVRPVWKDGKNLAFTIRHDYDRSITDERLDSILGAYACFRVKATWFILVEKPPDRSQLQAIKDAGHELALHTIAKDFSRFKDEVLLFESLVGYPPAGYSAHGGLGGVGYLGAVQWNWAVRLKFLYGEVLGKLQGCPTLVQYIYNGMPTCRKLVIPSVHHSLDLGMKDDAHDLYNLLDTLPDKMENGESIVLMSHPDIHWQELKELLESIDLSNAWCATLKDVSQQLLSCNFDGFNESFTGGIMNYRETGDHLKETFAVLSKEIHNWYLEHAPGTEYSTAAKLTIQMNTEGIPQRFEQLFAPFLDEMLDDAIFSLLDVGCGYGGMDIYAATRFPNATIDACDISNRFYEVAVKSSKGLNIQNLSFSDMALSEISDIEKYDYVVLSGMLPYLTSRKELITGCECAMRATKPSGWVIVHTPHFWTLREPYTKILGLQFLPRKVQNYVVRITGVRNTMDDVRLPSYGELKSIFAEFGGRVKICSSTTLLTRLKRSHFTMWVQKDKS